MLPQRKTPVAIAAAAFNLALWGPMQFSSAQTPPATGQLAGNPEAASPATGAAGTAAGAPTGEQTLPTVEVTTAKRLNEARSGIQTQTGASTYTFDASAIEAMPGGDNTLLNQVILQAPDVAQDSFGQFHVRGEHNGLQYRINSVILPEGMSVFGQALDSRLIDSMSLVTGALPAE